MNRSSMCWMPAETQVVNEELSIRCSRVVIEVLTWIVSSQLGARNKKEGRNREFGTLYEA